MRLPVTFRFIGLAFAGWLGLSSALADTIHLKNGRTIVADHVRESGTHYEYEIGDDSYAILKSAVDHVDAGGMPALAASGAAKIGDLPSFTPADFIAGKFEFERGNVARSQQYFENALRFQPDNSTILVYYAALLVRTGNASQAMSYAQRAVRAAPSSADAYTMLGYGQFASDHTREAITSWKRSLQLRPDAKVEQFLAKAQREQSVESDFAQGESSHFTLHYEGKQTSEFFRTQILAALESDYDDLARDLGNPPRDNIVVTLYTEQAFFDVTHAPGWSGALNDGKLRIPVSGLSSMTPELAHVLKHELAHSFITQLSGGRCPPWLHEGIAQFLEPRSLAGEGHQLALLFKAQRNIPLNALEGSFQRFSGAEAYVAYAESLAAVSY